MDYRIVNPSTTRSGGVMLLWKKEINIQLLFSAPNYIDVQIQERPDKIWHLTGVYGEPRWEDKYKTWDRIRELHSQHNLPWVLIGDFNEILFSHEKEGGNPRPLNFMQNFRDVLTDCNLHDIGFVGDQFTWRRGRIRERLDCALANTHWNNMHPDATLHHLEAMRSDHRPILLETEVTMAPGRNTSKKFEAKWLKEDSFQEVVEEAWEKANVEVSEGVSWRDWLTCTRHCMLGIVRSCSSQRNALGQRNANWNGRWLVRFLLRMKPWRVNRRL
jgi:hypothetical protein